MRVMIADDSMLMREGLARLLAEVDVDVLATSATADDLLARIAVTQPDVAVVDIKMPPTHTDEGIVAAQEIRARYPEVGVLLLSQYLEATYALRLLSEVPERVGYLLKDRVADVAVLHDGLQRICDGECVVDPTIVARLLRRNRKQDPLDVLTPREREVLQMMAEGRTNVAIGRALFMSEKTVEGHVRHVFSKLDLAPSPDDHRRVLAVLALLRAG